MRVKNEKGIKEVSMHHSVTIWHVYGLGKIGVLLWSDTYCGKVWTSWRKVEHAKQISWSLQAMSGNKFALELFSYWFLVSLSNRNLYRVSFFNENQGFRMLRKHLACLCAGDMISMKTYVLQLYNAKLYFVISKS